MLFSLCMKILNYHFGCELIIIVIFYTTFLDPFLRYGASVEWKF
jgi:hypothetical protein